MFRRLIVTTAAVAALAVPAAAQARPDLTPDGHRTFTVVKGGPQWDDQVPAGTHVDSVPAGKVAPAGDGFDWTDALIGGGAALALTVVLGGTALTVRPRTTPQH
jgi:hypothetical protein